VLSWNAPFNFSAINNFGVTQANGSIVGLINNDIEPIHGDWLEAMVRQVSRPEIGCVGAKLYYPNDTVQHAGVVLGIGGVAGHAHHGLAHDDLGYYCRAQLAQEISAVTAACLLVSKQHYQAVGGLDAVHLSVAFNDVDFCLKLGEMGLRNIYAPTAVLLHHESVSRGYEDTPVKQARFAKEVAWMQERWQHRLTADPAYNPNLTLDGEPFRIARPPRLKRWVS
jgi:GT2 family glycosyltransferase